MIRKIKNNPFLKNSAILFAGTMAVNILNYVFHLFLGRMASVELYGEIESLISLSSIISIPAATLGMIVIKYSAHTKAENNPYGSYLILKAFNQKIIVFGIPFFLFALAITPLIKSFLKITETWPIVLLWLVMFLGLFSSIASSVLTGWQKFREFNWVSIVSTLVKMVAGVGLLKIGFGASGVMGGFVLSGIIMYVLAIWFLRFTRKKDENSKKNIDYSAMKKYLPAALMGIVSITILNNVDMVLAKNKLDAIASGQYGALTVASKAIFFATGVLGSVLFTMSAEENHKKGNSLRQLRNATIITFLATIFAVIIYSLFPKFILGVFFGNKYDGVASYLGWFAIMVSLFSFTNLFIQYLLSIQKTKAAFSFLAIALIEILAIFLFAKSIYAIIEIVIVIQFIAIVNGLYFIFSEKKQNYG